MANNDTSSYNLRFNEINESLEYSAGLNWIKVPGVGSSVTASEIDSEAATIGQVLTADGTGGASWEDASGGGITELTGDVTAGPGSGSQAATLATVNTDVGSFTNANITVNAKGLITAAVNGSGATPGGNVNDIQINDGAGSFTGSDDLSFSAGSLQVTPASGNANITLHPAAGVPYQIWNDGTNQGTIEIESNTFIIQTNNKVMSMNDLNDDGAGDGSALLMMRSNTRGFVMPRLATPSASISAPIEGVIAYDTTNHVFTYYNGTTWKVLATV